MLLLGIDDAGRGPLIGPMMLAGVLVTLAQEKQLKQEGVADSKTLLHPLRVKLAGIIRDTAVKTYVAETSAAALDHSLHSGINLNTLEAMKAAEIINVLNDTKQSIKVIIDCPSNNISAWRAKVLGYIKHLDNLEVVCEHKADVNHACVSAASILAKVAREEAVAEIKARYGEIGSGYPSDPVTKDFLKKHGKRLRDSGIFRKTWSTWKTLFPEDAQKTLGEF